MRSKSGGEKVAKILGQTCSNHVELAILGYLAQFNHFLYFMKIFCKKKAPQGTQRANNNFDQQNMFFAEKKAPQGTHRANKNFDEKANTICRVFSR